MAVIANIFIDQGTDFSVIVDCTDTAGNILNLTGFTVAAQVWEETRTTKYADFTTTYTDRSAGSVSIALTDTQTATFTPDVLKYDVLLTAPSGSKEYYLEGTIYVSEGYTA